MRYYRYAPSVRLIVRHMAKDGEDRYFDLSDDVTNVRVTISQDAASSMSATVANPGNKYDSLFLPMDQFVLYASKDEPQRMMSGYVSSVSRMHLFKRQFTIRGYCPIYRMQRLYWDPNLTASWSVRGYASGPKTTSEDIIRALLKGPAAMTDNDFIIGQMPDQALRWAMDMFALRGTENEASLQMARELYSFLKNTGPYYGGPISGGGASASGGQGATQGLTAGMSIDVPANSEYGLQSPGATYTCYGNGVWILPRGPVSIDPSTNQKKVNDIWVDQGMPSVDGIAMINGRYLVALTQTFGTVGDMVDVYYDNGQILQCIIADEKSSGDSNYTMWGHTYEGYILVMEFEVTEEGKNSHSGNPGHADWLPFIDGALVTKVTNFGSILNGGA